ncbi:GNAT family N-acetyltransferase [Spongorhabdus nitratireducens]
MTSNNTNSDIVFSQVTGDQLGLVNRFYKANGHKGKCGREDRVYVARSLQGIVAAVRFTLKGRAWLLRGLWVAQDKRRQGLGYQLLGYCLPKFSEPVWCYPYAYLITFYRKAGFLEQGCESAPDNIASPWRMYRMRGESFALMSYSQQLPGGN